MDYAEVYIRYAAPVCVRTRKGRQVIPQIDAGIAQKNSFMDGHWIIPCNASRSEKPTPGHPYDNPPSIHFHPRGDQDHLIGHEC
ncbi:MAG: hypothetical protein DRH37_07270 [Deltaproteobacteria bacterium]|nr:MAG: hypothetical protein DRH37_07270 [Deltaproteobacteria bacterium]